MNLDSSFLIDLIEADADVVAKVEILDPDQLTVQALVYTEVGTGLDAGTSRPRRSGQWSPRYHSLQ